MAEVEPTGLTRPRLALWWLQQGGLESGDCEGHDFDASFLLVNNGTCSVNGTFPVTAVLSVNGFDVPLFARTLTIAPPLASHDSRLLTVTFLCPSPLTLTTQNIRFCIDRSSIK